MQIRSLVAAGAVALVAGTASAQILPANPTANNGGLAGWGIFFDLSASSPGVVVNGMTTASTAAAGASYTIEVFTRVGSGLGGPVASGPGSSPAGWTSLGIVNVTQGPVTSGVSLPFTIPSIPLTVGQTTGVALVFQGAGPRYFGTGTPPLQTFTDGTLTLVTGDARSIPFTTGGSFFSSRGLVGEIRYIPAPSTAALLALGGLVAARRRR